MALKPNRDELHFDTQQIKSSRPIPIGRAEYANAFADIPPDTIRPLDPEQWTGVLPTQRDRTVVAIAASGVGTGHAVELTVMSTADPGIDKTYRYLYENNEGRITRRDVTHDYSSPANGQVSNHHQTREETQKRLEEWPGFKF